MRKEYRKFLCKIAREISAEELDTMRFFCADFIPYTRLPRTESTLAEVFDFFCKLEAQSKLDIDYLNLLKEMLDDLNREELAYEVTSFQFQRASYLSSLSVDERESERSEITRRQQLEHQEEEQRQRGEPEGRRNLQPVANQTSRGAIVMQCAPYLVGGAWAVGSAYILNRYKEDPKALVNIVAEVVVPTGTLIKSIFAGSINFLLQATDLNSLKELWKRYQSGQLKVDLQKVLVTEELKNLAKGEPIDLVVTLSEEEYRNACLDLMVAQTKAQALYKGITSSQHASQLSRSLPDLTSLDTTQNLSRDFLLAQLSDELKRRQNARRVESIPSTVWSTENVSSFLEQMKSIQSEVNSIEVLTGKSCNDDETRMMHYMWGREERREVYNRVKRTNLVFSSFMDQLEEVRMFLKNERFLLHPQEAVKRLVLFAPKIKRYGVDDNPLQTALEELFGVQYYSIPFHSEKGKLRASIGAVVTKLKEMAKLLVKIFKLHPKLLKAVDFLEDVSSEDISSRISSRPSSDTSSGISSGKSSEDYEDYFTTLRRASLQKRRISPSPSPGFSKKAKIPEKATSMKGEELKYVQKKDPLQTKPTEAK